MSTVGYSVDVDKAWIQTASGGRFHILDPRPEEILIEDIAHALGMMCRFTGHVRKFYSVAEHCIHASYIVPWEDRLWALLHDSPEAYIADINRPLKHFTGVGKAYLPVEEKIMDAICNKFGLGLKQPDTVTAADTAMLYAEKDQLMPPMEWETKWGPNPTPADVLVQCWSPEESSRNYLRRFRQILEFERKK